MMYKLKTYSNGRVTGESDFDEMHEALAVANDALNTVTYPVDCDEFEITTTYKQRELIVCYGYDEDRALEEVRSGEVVSLGEMRG